MLEKEDSIIRVNGINIHVDNAASQLAMDTVVPTLFKSESQPFQTILQLTQTGIEQGTIRINGLDVHEVKSGEAIALVKHFKDGRKDILVPTKNTKQLYLSCAHEFSKCNNNNSSGFFSSTSPVKEKSLCMQGNAL